MLTLRATVNHVVLHCSIYALYNESNVFILFHFLWGCYGGALVFLGGAGAPASPSLAPPMYVLKIPNQKMDLTAIQISLLFLDNRSFKV